MVSKEILLYYPNVSTSHRFITTPIQCVIVMASESPDYIINLFEDDTDDDDDDDDADIDLPLYPGLVRGKCHCVVHRL